MIKKLDYIVVGCGLAGVAFSQQLIKHNKTFILFDNASQQSSVVAAGLYNPVILKRFSPVWKAKEQLNLIKTYNNIEKQLNIKVDYKEQILRRFNSVEEQNVWFNASDKPLLEPYLSTQLLKNTNPNINAIYSLGEVKYGGRLDTKTLIASYKNYLKANTCLMESSFNYSELKIESSKVKYKEFEAKHFVFAEGYGLKQNPYFKYLPLNGTKGEILTIHAPELKLNAILKSSVFVIPIGNDKYKIGSTYNREDKSNTPTKEGKEELLSKLKTFILSDFEVTDHIAGIRPTVKDRRPLVGQHPKHNNLYVLNGLGTRGVMIAPYVAEKLFNFIENATSIDADIDIKRFLN